MNKKQKKSTFFSISMAVHLGCAGGSRRDPKHKSIKGTFVQPGVGVYIFSKITKLSIIVCVLGVFLATNREFRIYGSSVKILDANEGLGHFYPNSVGEHSIA